MCEAARNANLCRHEFLTGGVYLGEAGVGIAYNANTHTIKR